MSLLTFLRILNGCALTLALCGWGVLVAWQWTGRFAKGAVQTAVATTKLFVSAFTQTSPPAKEPYVDTTMWLAGAALFMMGIALFVPGKQWFLHLSAMAALILGVWNMRASPDTTGPWTAGVVVLWSLFYYVAAWKR